MVDEVAAKIEDAWLDAAEQLGIDVEAPYVIDTAAGSATFLAFLPDFGGPNGMVLASADVEEGDLPTHVANDAGLFRVEVTERYATYDEDLFRDSLNDWGWYGPRNGAPDWYDGHTWT